MLRINSRVAFSVTLHAVVVGLLFFAVMHAPKVAAYRMPGTTQGAHLLTYFSPGVAAAAESKGRLLPVLKRVASRAPSVAAPTPTPPPSVASQAEKGTGTTAVSGLGNGEITMALQKSFPPPQPDLSTIAPGHHGEVVLNAVIDEQGKIAQLTLLKGITPVIDETVIATVENWTYQPATRNGTPVSSEQELHFYYERG